MNILVSLNMAIERFLEDTGSNPPIQIYVQVHLFNTMIYPYKLEDIYRSIKY